jgi:hypothetical protein
MILGDFHSRFFQCRKCQFYRISPVSLSTRGEILEFNGSTARSSSSEIVGTRTHQTIPMVRHFHFVKRLTYSLTLAAGKVT